MNGTITLEGGSWVVDTKPHVRIRLKRVFPRVSGHGRLAIQDTPEVCRELLWFCERFPHEVTPLDHMQRRAEAHRQQEQAYADLLSGACSPRKFDLALPPRPYQAVAAELALTSRGLLVADDLGLGKTLSAIAVLVNPEARPALVVCYPHLQKQWEREIHRFAPGLTTHILKKGTPYRIGGKPGQGDLFGSSFPDVIISTYHKLSGWADHLAEVIKAVVWDEVQELRRPTSAKYSAALHLATHADYRVGLSATPIYNYGGEAYHVLECIQPGALGSWSEFLSEWCTRYGDKPRLSDPQAFGAYLRDSGLMIRRTRKDVARELPDLTRAVQYIDADMRSLDEVADSAAELARIILAQGGESFVKMKAAGELNAKVRQATGVAKAKYAAAFVSMLVEQGEKVVLFGWHREVYSIWMEELKDCNPVMYTGSESVAQKEAARKAFVEGDANVFVMSLRSGAGLDGLQGICRNVVFGELDWSPGVHEQCMGRVHRDGQDDPVVAYYLVSDAGSDPIMVDVLGLKREQVEGVIDPDAELVERLDTGVDHVKLLARAYLRKEAA